MKKRTAGALSLICLTAAYLLLRYPLLYLHGMKQWPFLLFIVGAVVIALSGLVLCRRLLPLFTATGYAVGFAAGYLMQSDYGVGLNNLWMIWAGVYLAAILAGAAAELLRRGRTAN